ncbi:MAG: SDR family NAD(P)-dependent oxidoreductase [Burkholderiaceae bacterium]|nr:SDR family NAD(P)-dependent oxidoreductase [Burkholderiaceae bacterium]
MQSFPGGFQALIIGSSGSIGSAFLDLLRLHPDCAKVIGLHRHSQPAINFENEESIGQAASNLSKQGPFHLIINAAGILHTPHFTPEKKLSNLNYAQIEKTFRVNAFGPALILNYFSKLLHPAKGVMVMLSAKVGSIEDNRLGGWYSYRASKAALNMFLKTAAIELQRIQPNTTVIALHPGTVNSNLSKPFRGEQIGRAPVEAVREMWQVIEGLQPQDTGKFYSYNGQVLPW